MKAIVAVLGVLLTAGVAQAQDNPGKAVYTKNGCVACHAIGGQGGKIGPALDKVGAKGKDYIRESIVQPDKVVTQGFAAGIMPKTFEKTIKPEDMTKLVDYLATLK